MADNGLTSTLNAIQDETQKGDKISVGDIVEALNSRGYGALLIGPALITVLPTGAIPGIPAICSLLIIFISVQILMGRSEPWLPKRFKEISFSRKDFMSKLGKVKPYTKKVDKFFYPRMEYLVRHEIQPFIAVLCIILAINIVVLGWIPFLAMVPAAAILLLGLGLSAKDGLLVGCSFIFVLGSFAVMGSILYNVMNG